LFEKCHQIKQAFIDVVSQHVTVIAFGSLCCTNARITKISLSI